MVSCESFAKKAGRIPCGSKARTSFYRCCSAVLLALSVAAATSEWPLRCVVAEELAEVWIEPATSSHTSYCCNNNWLSLLPDYLYWWTRGVQLPPLVTTSPMGVEMQDAGVIGEPGTQVLFGDELTSSGPRSGMCWSAGVQLDDMAMVGDNRLVVSGNALGPVSCDLCRRHHPGPPFY